jgi:hypothetical protein
MLGQRQQGSKGLGLKVPDNFFTYANDRSNDDLVFGLLLMPSNAVTD